MAAVVLLLAAAPPSPITLADDGPPPTLTGYGSQYRLLEPVRIARLTPFQTANGETSDLGRFRGKVVLLTFWATWCVPCVYEMPSLDRLAAETSDDKLAIVPIAIDEAGLRAVLPFYRDRGLKALPIYLDPEQRTAYLDAANPNGAEFAIYGLPISYVIDHEGRAMGYIAGAVDWDSEQARAFLRYYTKHVPD